MQPWQNTTVRIIAPGTAGPPPVAGRSANVPAQIGIYKFSDPKGVHGRATWAVVAFHDPLTQTSYVFPSDASWFLAANNSLTGLTEAYSTCFFSPPFVALPDASGDLAAAIAQFESTWTSQQILAAHVTRLSHRLSFQSSLPPAFYGTQNQKPQSAHNPVPAANVQITAASITDGILHLNVSNLPTKQTATIRINLATQKILPPPAAQSKTPPH
jgi:hypothetical protein